MATKLDSPYSTQAVLNDHSKSSHRPRAQVPARRLDRIACPDPGRFQDLYFRKRRAVIVVGALEDWPAESRSFSELARRLGDARVEVDRMGRAPFEFSGERRTVTTPMRLADFVQGVELGTGYVQAREDQVTDGFTRGRRELPFVPRSYLRRIDSVWLGGGGGYGLHHDIGSDQFLCQLHGRKRVLLLRDDLRNTRAVGLEPLTTGRFYRSRLRDALDPRSPCGAALSTAERYEDVLQPGEVLYIPCAWFHDLRPLEPSITLGQRYLLASRFVGGVLSSLARHVVASALPRLTTHA